MVRMRMSGLCDHTYWWQSSHPDNPKLDPDRIWQWMTERWKHIQKITPKAIVSKEDAADFDENVCQFDLYYVPKWPTDQIIGKRIRDDGTFSSAERWINRLIDSIKKHGIIDPILAWCHVPSQTVKGRPPGTPNVVLGSNRIAVAQHLGIPHVPVIVSFPKGKSPPHPHQRISFEELHDEFMGHRGDLWVTPTDWYMVHPPTVFHDHNDGRQHDFDHPRV